MLSRAMTTEGVGFFKQPGAKRFESPRPALAGRGRNLRSEFRVRGSLREHSPWREPLTPPSPRKGGARETREHGSAFSRRDAPERCLNFCPRNNRGRRECRVRSAPAAACATKSTRVSNHRYAAINRHSLRDGFTAYIALSPGTGLFCPRHFRRNCFQRKLSASVGAPGPHDFAVRISAARLASLSRPPHPAPRS
jgi:hypothetical protein